MANKLKIYACSGVGSVAKKRTGYDYWTDNTSSISNTQAVNTLLSIINLNNSEVLNIRLPKAQQIERLNTIDLCVVCLDAAQQFALNDERLAAAGRAIGAMCDEGLFRYESTKNSDRDKHLDGLLATFDYYYQSGKSGGDDDFWAWWQEKVQSRNKVGLTTTQQNAIKQAIKQGISGIGDAELNWQDNAELAKYLNDAGNYFLYLYFTDEQLARVPYKFTMKRNYQEQVYNYCKGLYVKQFGSEAEMQNIIRGSIVGQFKMQPEEVCARIAAQKYEGIGLDPLMVGLISLVAIIVGALTIVKLICDAVAKSNVAKYQSLNSQIINGGLPNTDDFEGLDSLDDLNKKSNSWVTIGIIVAGLIFLLKN